MVTLSPDVRRYSSDSHIPKPFMIGVCGGPSSGKSQVCQKIIDNLEQKLGKSVRSRIAVISMQLFYRPLSKENLEKANEGTYNFDHPESTDFERLIAALKTLLNKESVDIPETYDFTAHRSSEETRTIPDTVDIVIVEGILAFYSKPLRDLFHLKVFVELDSETRLSRRVTKDVEVNGRNLSSVLHQYINLVKPSYEQFCFPTKQHADLIIPRGPDNDVAINDLFSSHLVDILNGTPQSANRTSIGTSPVTQTRPH